MKYNRKLEGENKELTQTFQNTSTCFSAVHIKANGKDWIKNMLKSQLTVSSGSENPVITVEHLLHCWIQTYYQHSSISAT